MNEKYPAEAVGSGDSTIPPGDDGVTAANYVSPAEDTVDTTTADQSVDTGQQLCDNRNALIDQKASSKSQTRASTDDARMESASEGYFSHVDEVLPGLQSLRDGQDVRETCVDTGLSLLNLQEDPPPSLFGSKTENVGVKNMNH